MERLIDDDIGDRVSGTYRTHEAKEVLDERLKIHRKPEVLKREKVNA
jgi:hypothetical protein